MAAADALHKSSNRFSLGPEAFVPLGDLASQLIAAGQSCGGTTSQSSTSHDSTSATKKFKASHAAPPDASWTKAPAPLCQQQLFDAVSVEYPDVLTKSIYRQVPLVKPLYTMSLQEKQELFVEALKGMRQQIEEGRSADDVAYDNEQSRLWSFGLQPMWEVHADKRQSRLVGAESLLALHCGSWGVGLVLDVLENLLNTELETYLQFKELEIQAAVCALEAHPGMPPISVNLRPSEWMFPEVQRWVLDSANRVPGRISFELTEYTHDSHFVRLFGEKGTLAERLTKTLLPVLRRMQQAGVILLADDMLPGTIYAFDSEAARTSGHRLADHHATECGTILSEEWAGVFHGVKFGLEWVIHAMPLGKETGADYAKVPLYARNVKDSPAYVAAVTDATMPEAEADAAEALVRLQNAAKAELKTILDKVRPAFDALPVLEGTVPSGVVEDWGLPGIVKEQGGIFFEGRFPPAWFFGKGSEKAAGAK